MFLLKANTYRYQLINNQKYYSCLENSLELEESKELLIQNFSEKLIKKTDSHIKNN